MLDFERALYTMDIGQNDITSILYLPYDEVLAKLPHFVAEIRKAIEVHMVQRWISINSETGVTP